MHNCQIKNLTLTLFYNRYQNSNMYFQTGNMRDINHDSSPIKNSVIWDRQNQFEYGQRSKYQKSQASYAHQQRSKVVYEQHEKTERVKHIENNQIGVTVPIKIKSSEREDYLSTFKIQLTSMSDKNNNCLTMHITNDSDSLFLWSFFVRESEFLMLKNQQSLKVDFHGFPEVIMTYLNSCKNAQKQQFNSQSNDPKFYAVLDIKKGNMQSQLKILEANKYKQSLHLSLVFKKANDEQLKIYLSQKYDKQRKENNRLYSQLLEVQTQFSRRGQKLERLKVQFDQMEKEKNIQIEELQRRQKQRIKQIVLKMEEDHMKKEKGEEQRKKKDIQQLQKKIQQLTLKNEQLSSNYQKCHQKLVNIEVSQSNLKYSSETQQKLLQQYQKSNKQLKTKQITSNEEYHKLKNENTRLLFMVESLSEKIKEKEERLSENIQLKSNNFSQISNLQENLRQQRNKIAKLEEKNEAYQNQIAKLNKKYEDSINKYQKKKDIITDFKEIIKRQQQKINTLERDSRKGIQDILDVRRDKERLDLQLKDRDNKIKDLKAHIQQNQQYIEGQKKIISDLNKRLNQKSVGIKNFTIPNSIPTYSSFVGTVGTLPRDFTSTLSSTSESRIKYSPSPISTSPLNQKPLEKIAPPFRKYRQGIENDKDQQNASHSQTHSNSHSRSPITSKLSQQMDPQQVDRTKQKIGPIKFKK